MEKPEIGPYAEHSFDAPVVNCRGDYVLYGRFSSDTSVPLSMWIRTDRAIELVARHGEPVPDDTAGATFHDFAGGCALIERRIWRS